MHARRYLIVLASVFAFAATSYAFLANVVPTDIEQPGTQPEEVGTFLGVDKCDNCHGGYDQSVEPIHTWRGGMMANASRDPLFWATLAVAEQDFDGSGDLCLRCHTTTAWMEGRSEPTDGTSLLETDANGVECAFCHRMTNTDDSEYQGVMNAPYVANDGGQPAIGYYGTGMTSLWPSNARFGPYANVSSNHASFQSLFHRDVKFCGTCHDVSNPAVGDLAHNNGAQPWADPVIASGLPGGPVADKAAFNNFPFMYGVVERTFSEFMAGTLAATKVSDYDTLPAELKRGSIARAHDAALVAGKNGDYEDGTVRYFSCQTCHMAPVTGKGANKNSTPVRKDLPHHDMTGGNYWAAEAMKYLDGQGKLRLGGGLTADQKAAP